MPSFRTLPNSREVAIYYSRSFKYCLAINACVTHRGNTRDFQAFLSNSNESVRRGSHCRNVTFTSHQHSKRPDGLKIHRWRRHADARCGTPFMAIEIRKDCDHMHQGALRPIPRAAIDRRPLDRVLDCGFRRVESANHGIDCQVQLFLNFGPRFEAPEGGLQSYERRFGMEVGLNTLPAPFVTPA